MGLWGLYTKDSKGSIRIQACGVAELLQAFWGFYKDPGLWGCGGLLSIQGFYNGAAGVYQAFKGFYKDPGLGGCGGLSSIQGVL